MSRIDRWSLLLLLILALTLNWYYLGGGYQADDLLLLDLMDQQPRQFSRWQGVWSVTELPAFNGAWWFEPEALGGFLRPLPSLVIEGSSALLGDRAWALHGLSVLLHGMVAVLLAGLVRRMTGRSGIGFLAGLLFLACEDHSMGVGWISTQTDLLGTVFLLLALGSHLRWLQTRRPGSLAASLVLLIPALTSKESTVIAPLVMVATCLLLPTGRPAPLPGCSRSELGERLDRFARDWVSWGPALLVLVAYMILRKSAGLGVMNNLMYVDPLADPLRYLRIVLLHGPIMILATVSPVPPSLAMFLPRSIPVLAGAGTAALILWLLILRPLRRNPVLIWSLLGYGLSLLPQLSAGASERALYLPMVFASIPLALLLARIRPLARRLQPEEPPAPWTVQFGGWAVLLTVLIPGLLLSAYMPFRYLPSLETPGRRARAAAGVIRTGRFDPAILLNTPGGFDTFYAPGIASSELDGSVDIRVLCPANAVVSVEHRSSTDLVIRCDRPGWLSNPFAGLLRTPIPLVEGRTYPGEPFSVTLLEVTPDGGDVLAALFRFPRGLDEAGLGFLAWDGRRYHPLDPMELPLGEIRILADTSNLWASMG